MCPPCKITKMTCIFVKTLTIINESKSNEFRPDKRVPVLQGKNE